MEILISGPRDLTGSPAAVRAKNGPMVARPPARTVQVVPPLLVMMLKDLGKLPDIPNLPQPGALGFRTPGLREMESVTWIAVWEGDRLDEQGFRKVAGLAAFRDIYDWHSASDVRDVVAIRGSRRAIVELTIWMRDDAAKANRRLFGSFERFDLGLAQVMARLGGVSTTRVTWEYLP